MSDWSGQWKSTDHVMEKYFLLIWSQTCLTGQVDGKVLSTWYVYYKSETLVTAFHSSSSVMTDPSPEESPTRYMLPDQEGRKGLVDYSLNDHSPARYPIVTKKRKKSDKKTKKTKKLKKEPSKSVQFRPTVTLKTIYRTLKSQKEDIGLANEEDYPSRVTAFALKRKSQKEILKYQHQYRPLTPRRLSMQKHVRDTKRKW